MSEDLGVEYKTISLPKLKGYQPVLSPIQIVMVDGEPKCKLPLDRHVYFLGEHLKSGIIYLLHGLHPVSDDPNAPRPNLAKEDLYIEVGRIGNFYQYPITDMKYRCEDPHSSCKFQYADSLVGGELLLPSGRFTKTARAILDYAADPVKSGVASSRPDIIHQTRDLEVRIRNI
jgi:hypothetical protein